MGRCQQLLRPRPPAKNTAFCCTQNKDRTRHPQLRPARDGSGPMGPDDFEHSQEFPKQQLLPPRGGGAAL